MLAGVAVWCAFRIRLAIAARAAVLLAATLLAAPHSGGYDLLLLVAADALFLSCLGPRTTGLDRSLALLIWLAPLLGLPITSPAGRFCPVLSMALLTSILWNARAPGLITQAA
jgi:hypothetical protein